MGVKAFIQNFLNSDNEYVTAAPNFEYYPTEDQVLGLVERALTMV